MINTISGPVNERTLDRTLVVEDQPAQLAVRVYWRHDGQLVHEEAYPLPKEIGPDVYTTLGQLPIERLYRYVELHDTPDNIAVAVVWLYEGQLVRRDAHLILKAASVVTDAIAASF